MSFVFGEVFPADDVLAEWVATLAIAFNDISLVHERLEAEGAIEHRFFYWLRLGIAHFPEAASFLRSTRDVGEIRAFVESLPDEVRGHYDRTLAVYDAHNKRSIAQIRNLAAFHYPELRVQRARRPVQDALRSLAEARGRVKLGTIREGRHLYADDIVSVIFTRSTPTWADVAALHGDVSEGTASFMRFANPALEEYSSAPSAAARP